jgi:FtsH-binding integral membrane protein
MSDDINKDQDNRIPLIEKKVEKIEDDKELEEENNDYIELNQDEDNEASKFKEKMNKKSIIFKNKLISKIYFIFFIQLGIIFLFIYYAFHQKNFKSILQNNASIFYSAIGLSGMLIFACHKWKKILTITPFNYFFFIIFTTSISIVICKISILFSYKSIAVLWSLLLVLTLSLSIYCLAMKVELVFISTVVLMSVIVVLCGVIIKFIAQVDFVDILFIFLCLISLEIYLIYDINSLIEDKNISPKEYLLVNILLYGDFIRLFIKLVNFIYENFKSDDNKDFLGDLHKIAKDVKNTMDEIEDLGKDKKKETKKKGKKEDKKEDKKKKGKKNDKDDKKKKNKKHKKTKKDDDDEEEGENNNIFGMDYNDFAKKGGEFFANFLG